MWELQLHRCKREQAITFQYATDEPGGNPLPRSLAELHLHTDTTHLNTHTWGLAAYSLPRSTRERNTNCDKASGIFYIFVATKRKKQVKFINEIVQLAPPTSTISHAHPIYFIYILWHTVLFDSFAGQLITFSGLRRAAEADFKTLQLLVCSTMLALPAVPSD